jgi:hypothetical protein
MPPGAVPDMSSWQEERAERNRQALARLTRPVPTIFPSGVLTRALSRPLVPPPPRLAIDGYWRAHPIRADRRSDRTTDLQRVSATPVLRHTSGYTLANNGHDMRALLANLRHRNI